MADHEPIMRNPDNDYERTDVDVRAIGVAALLTLIWLAVIPLILTFGYRQATRDAFKPPTVTPPEPRLQVDPNRDLEEFRRHEQERLTSYGWVDRDKGIVHIPIDEALAKAAHEGIPDWPAPAGGQARAQGQGQAQGQKQ